MRRLGRVVPKNVLEEKLYGIDEEPVSNAIPVHVHHLRRKPGEAGAAESGASAPGSSSAGAGARDDKVVDAEFEEVDEKKKKSA